jgi:hypothetical protein
MKELLSKWAALEPERCKHWDAGSAEMFTAKLGWRYHPVWMAGDEEEPSLGRQGHLQAAVQEVIEAREWIGDLEFTKGCAGACVLTPVPFNATGATAAEALLGAYLTAVEARS